MLPPRVHSGVTNVRVITQNKTLPQKLLKGEASGPVKLCNTTTRNVVHKALTLKKGKPAIIVHNTPLVKQVELKVPFYHCTFVNLAWKLYVCATLYIK